jgi:hypothetical protein
VYEVVLEPERVLLRWKITGAESDLKAATAQAKEIFVPITLSVEGRKLRYDGTYGGSGKGHSVFLAGVRDDARLNLHADGSDVSIDLGS